jgi:hypothetical protein
MSNNETNSNNERQQPMTTTTTEPARRFRLERLPATGTGITNDYLRDKRGRVREFGDVRRAVRALIDANENPDAWRVWFRDAHRIGWTAYYGSATTVLYVANEVLL